MEKKRDRIMGLAFVVILGLSCLYFLSGAENQREVDSCSLKWNWNDYTAVKAKAHNENKYILIDFWATWCKECNQMDEEAFKDPKVVHLLEKFVLLKVDVDKAPQLKAQFTVVGMPTIIVLNSRGKEIARVVGYQDAEQLTQFLQQVFTQGL